ncbi:hypothetical protein ACJX0J_038182, partial [Zea mays]
TEQGIFKKDKEGLDCMYSSSFLTKEVSLFWLSNNLRVLRASATFVGSGIYGVKEGFIFFRKNLNAVNGIMGWKSN